MKTLGLALCAALTVFVSACGDDGTTSSSTSSSSSSSSGGGDGGGGGGATQVTVSSNKFEPKEVTIEVGKKVKWTWAGGNHSVVSGTGCAPDAKFTSGAPVSTVGNTFEKTFDTAGTFEYYCDPHCSQGMTGKITVK